MFKLGLTSSLLKAGTRNIRYSNITSNVARVSGIFGLKNFQNQVPAPRITSAHISTPILNQVLEMPSINELTEENVNQDNDNTMYLDSVLRKRRLKMKKHKLRKRRRNQRALKKRLGKL